MRVRHLPAELAAPIDEQLLGHGEVAARDLMGWPASSGAEAVPQLTPKKKESSQKNSSGAYLYAELSPADFVAISVGKRSVTECSEPGRDASVNGPALLATEDIAAEN